MVQPAGSPAGPVLVTGASGFIGSAIVQAFGRAGYPVRALVRRSSPRTNLIDSGCEIVEGDVRDREAITAALKDVRYLVHAAADYRLWAPYVDDIAAGHLAALERARIGEQYILGGEDVLLRQMLAEIAQQIGRRPPRLKLPLALMFPLAWGSETVARLTGGNPFVTRDSLHMARHRMFFTHEKARRELGYGPRPYQQGLADAIAWFRKAGYLR